MKLGELIPTIIQHKMDIGPVHIKDPTCSGYIAQVAPCTKHSTHIRLSNKDNFSWKKYYDEAMQLEVSQCEMDDRKILSVYVKGWAKFCEDRDVVARYL